MEEKIVEINDISYAGSGVGRVDGKVLFVPKTLKGEKVSAYIERDTSSFSVGRLKEVLSPSNKRIEPKCRYFSVCGGCAFQHCDRDEERKIKTNILKNEMSKIGFDGEIDFVEGERRYNYRNKIKLEVRGKKLGYFKENSKDFFEVDCCPIADDEIEKNIKNVQKIVFENNFLKLKNIYFKIINKKVAICFLFDKNARKTISEINFSNYFSKNILIYFAYGDVLESNETKIEKVFGDGQLEMNVLNQKVPISVSGFNQVNDEIAEKLYDYVSKLCEKKRVINAYSGQGLLTYLISKSARFVYGIEFLISAHNAAEKLCQNVLDYKIENICGKVEDEIGKIVKRDKIDLIVLDPAREGCKPNVLTEIDSNKIEKVVYVSCNFSTLVRDLRLLTEHYQIESVKIFDMFPCCALMETVVVLKRS